MQRQATLVSARALSSSVRELTFDPGPDFKFVPGQWVNLWIAPAQGEPVKRSYSIASPPRANGTFDLAVTLVTDGPASSALHAAKPGDSFPMSHAQGFFTLMPPTRNVLMIATGTGVAPFRSVLRDLETREDDVRFTLLFGARFEEDILYRDEFESLSREWPSFRFASTLSRGGDAWSGRRGYVQTHVAELVADLGGASAIDAYVCGLQKMVGDVRKMLKDPIGVPRDRIHHERYD
jgi:ferredoxin-NADP reductase